jgi:hypothetical protein
MRNRLRLLARLVYLLTAFLARSAGERAMGRFMLRRWGLGAKRDNDGVPNLDPAHLDRAGNYIWPKNRGRP